MAARLRCLAVVAAAAAVALPGTANAGGAEVSIYPADPDPRLPVLIKASGVLEDPQPYAGIACDGAEPAPELDLNADVGAPLVWVLEPADLCTGTTLTAAVYERTPTGGGEPSYREVARETVEFAAAGGARVVPYLRARGSAPPLYRPPPARINSKALIGVRAAGLPAGRVVYLHVELLGKPRKPRRCKVRERDSAGPVQSDGTLQGNVVIAGSPASVEKRFCPGRAYRVVARDRDSKRAYGSFRLRVRG
jgi:hypothetical protein